MAADMLSTLGVGDTLQAKYTDGYFYPAEVVLVSHSSKRAKAPVKVRYQGFGPEDDAWLAVADIKSSRGSSRGKSKKLAVDLSGLEIGMRLHVKADDDIWYVGEVLAVNKQNKRKHAPIKVNYCGYTSASDEWVGADRLRSKALKSPEEAAVKAGADRTPAAAFDVVPILKNLRKFARSSTIGRAVVESSPKADSVTMTYKDLLANVEPISKQIANLLGKRDEKFPKHVAFLVNPSIAYAVTEFSIWAAGAACVPLSVHSPAPELEYFIEDSECSLLITDESSYEKLKPTADKLDRKIIMIKSTAPSKYSLSVDGTTDVPDEGTPASKLLSTSWTAAALILYTSGTTGKPKGVVHTHKSLTAQYQSLSTAWKWSPKDYTLHVLPMHHIHGVQNIFNTAMFNGAGVEFCPFDAEFCLRRLGSGDITCFHAVPTIYVKFTQCLDKVAPETRAELCKGLRNDSMRYMVSGSAALPVPTMKSWATISGHVLLERYGMTEIGMGLSNKINDTRYPGCVGWAMPKVKVKVDEEGAVLIKAPQNFVEYWKNPEATKKEFTEDGWFKTGDNVQCGGTEEEIQKYQDDARDVEAATGRPRESTTKEPAATLAKIYKIMGRSSVDIIKSGGYKISALEIESILLQHDAISECAVVGQPDETWGEKVTAVCVMKGDLTIKELREWGKERMATYKVPQELEVVTELPRNQMGKLEKKKILDKYKKL